MRAIIAPTLALVAGLSSGSATAQVGALPHLFAGYSQPALGAGACKATGPSEAQCQIPAMTAGRYLIEAAGTSSGPGVGANQSLEIDVAGRTCGVGRNSTAWTSGARTFRLDCEVTIVADQPVAVKVIYADAQATKDPKGPAVTIRPLPWIGVLSTQPFAPKQ
jgi:hypothetical protein